MAVGDKTIKSLRIDLPTNILEIFNSIVLSHLDYYALSVTNVKKNVRFYHTGTEQGLQTTFSDLTVKVRGNQLKKCFKCSTTN